MASPLTSDDTIVAVSTAPGRSAIALIRLSGPEAFPIARRHIDSWPATTRHAQLSAVRDNDGNILDRALVTLFDASGSFSGEDTVEISCHGGYLVPASIVATLISAGARQASPGEFTRRAVLNGKLDLLQAEAIADLIDARSAIMHKTALEQLDGGLSRRLGELRNDLIGLEALLAYDVDFPEEDDGPIPRERIEAATRTVITSLKDLLATSTAGELIREGAVVVIAGPPNVGKSSLFNALLGRSRAIVTEIPGTTRDALEAVIDSGEWPLRLVDTAGLRTTGDHLERLGIEVSERYLAEAEVILACADNAESLDETLLLIGGKSKAVTIPVWTKADLVASSSEVSRRAILVSAQSGQGLRELLTAVSSVLSDQHGEVNPNSHLPILTRARHRHALSSACQEVESFDAAWKEGKLPATVAAVHLRTAVSQLEDLIGTVGIEDVLDRVFSSFCVGK